MTNNPKRRINKQSKKQRQSSLLPSSFDPINSSNHKRRDSRSRSRNRNSNRNRSHRKSSTEKHSKSKQSKKSIQVLPKVSCPKIEETYAEDKSTVLSKLGQGTYGITFRSCFNVGCSIKQGIKLSSIKSKYKDDDTHPTNIEVNFGREITEYVRKKYTPNINRILDSFRCDIADLKKLKSLKSSEWLLETKDLLAAGDVYPYANVYFMEFGTMDLQDFIRMRLEQATLAFPEILEVLFQVFHTLSVIQHQIPHYRHNDLKPNNLIVRVNGGNLKRDFTYSTTCHCYKNGQTSFYVPHRGYVVKIIDFDFTYSKKYQNAKITNYANTNFRELGYGPFVNPTFDLHFLLNAFYNSKSTMKTLPKFKEFIKSVIPKDCIGYQNEFVERGKLTAYFSKDPELEGETNYIPPKLFTPCEMLHFTKHFDFLKTPGESKVVKEYASPFKAIDSTLRKRTDMFNVYLVK